MASELGRHYCGDDCDYPRPVSLDDEWEQVPTPSGAQWCYKIAWRGGSKLTGAGMSGKGKPCQSWDHRPCAERKGHQILAHLTRWTDQYPNVWVAFAESNPRLMARVKERRRAAGVNAYFWVRRVDGLVVFVFDRPISGPATPVASFKKTPREACKLVANVGLHLPGVAVARFGGAWQGKRDKLRDDVADAKSDVVTFGMLSDMRYQEAFQVAAARAQALYGVTITDPEEPIPVGIPIEVWFKLMGQAARRS